MKTGAIADENVNTSVLQQSHGLSELNSQIMLGNGEKIVRSTLQSLNPKVSLTRLNEKSDCEPTKAGGSVSVRRVSVESPLCRELLVRCALSASRRPSRHDDSAMATRSKRHQASKTSSTRPKCRCFGRPSVCSICLTRSILSIRVEYCYCHCVSVNGTVYNTL